MVDATLPTALADQAAVYEFVDVAFKDAVCVRGFVFGPVILDHAIRLQHVRTDLTSPGDVQLGVFDRLKFFLFLFQFELVDAGTQDLPGHVAIANLRTLVLAAHDDSCGDVRNPDRRVRDVDMLAARAGGSVGVNTKVLFLDLDLDLVVDFRIDINRGEACMAAGRRVKWRDTHQPVNTALGIKLPVGIVSFHQEGCGLYAAFLPLLVIQY